MNGTREQRRRELEAALTAEAAAAADVTAALQGARRAAERMRGGGLDDALGAARSASARLEQRGAARLRTVTRLARELGLPSSTPLAGVVGALGNQTSLTAAERRLGTCLDGLSQEVAALTICARYGEAACTQLLALRGGRTAPSYGPNGRVTASRGGVRCRI